MSIFFTSWSEATMMLLVIVKKPKADELTRRSRVCYIISTTTER